jgi:uncharacterized protein YcsI (UPF0317 family)
MSTTAVPVVADADRAAPRTPAGAVLRTDLPRYQLWRDGELADVPVFWGRGVTPRPR